MSIASSGPAIAIMEPAQPRTVSAGTKSWQMRCLTGSIAFLTGPVRICHDDPLRAAQIFTHDLNEHALATNTRPWLILPDAATVLRNQPTSHQLLLCSDQPTPAIPYRHADAQRCWSTRVDNNRTEMASLILDLEGDHPRLTRYDPSIRKAGRVRLLGTLQKTSIDIPDQLRSSIPSLSNTNDGESLALLMRSHFWSDLNAAIALPYLAGESDPTLKQHPISYRGGDADSLQSTLSRIAWSDLDISEDRFPFEVAIESAVDVGQNARLVNAGNLTAKSRPAVDAAISAMSPTGWRMQCLLEDELPRRCDWHRIPFTIHFNISRPTSHDRMAAIHACQR